LPTNIAPEFANSTVSKIGLTQLRAASLGAEYLTLPNPMLR